jgi:ribosomal protein S10
MKTKSQLSKTENFHLSSTDSSLWHDISERTQATVCGGANEKIRIRLKSFDHRLENDTSYGAIRATFRF